MKDFTKLIHSDLKIISHRVKLLRKQEDDILKYHNVKYNTHKQMGGNQKQIGGNTRKRISTKKYHNIRNKFMEETWMNIQSYYK